MAKRKTSATKNTTKKVPLNKTGSTSVKEDKFLIVGMGASAGGLEAFKEFFANMPQRQNKSFAKGQ